MTVATTGLARPTPRPWHAVTGLDHFAIVTWAVEPERLAATLPTGIVARTVAIDGAERALVSAVAFADRDFRFRGAPFVRMSCGQVNYRAYVRHGGEDGVWFFGTSLGHPLVAVARWLWAMPWHHDRVAVSGTWDGDGPSVRVDVPDGWGRLRLDLGGPGAAAAAGPGPWDEPWVTDPLIGWYPRIRGGLGRYSVWHDPLPLRPIGVRHAHSTVFEVLGLIDRGQEPVAARAVAATEFDVLTPPHRLPA